MAHPSDGTVLITIPHPLGGADQQVAVSNAGAEQLASRLRKVAKERRKWAKKENVACYRVYDADLPEYAAAVDVYLCMEDLEDDQGNPLPVSALTPEQTLERTYVHVAEYQAPRSIDPQKAADRFDDLMACIPAVMGVPQDRVFAKVRKRDRGGSQYAENRTPYEFMTTEDGLRFIVDMNGYLDTGLFLDHRSTRISVGKLAKGRRFLNLFSYTGSATVHAAAGGARATVTVDLSSTYLDWAKRNMKLNGFTGKNHVYQKADTLTWLDKAIAAELKFDLIFVDPPTFSNSKSMGNASWDVQRDHVKLLDRVTKLLAPGGVAVFSCNLRTFKPAVEELEAKGIRIKDVSRGTIPHDFERNPKIHYCFTVARI
ncbi:MAG: class I SAM-dependent methyltransferase [Coriobacteriia bacterium]|nr:class I SAM-dependent methyltransferase [Coriobacteriia bacterium]